MINNPLIIMAIMIVFGGLAIWLIIKLFSTNPPSLMVSLAAAAVTELVAIFNIPFLSLIILLLVLIKMGDFSIMHAILAVIIYGLIKWGLVIFLVSATV